MSASNSKEKHQLGTIERWMNQVFALLWVAGGVVVFLQSRKLKYADDYGPGPGFLPFWLGVGFVLLGLLLLGQATLSRKESEGFSLPSKHAMWQMSIVTLGFFGFVFLADKVGFLLCVGLLFFFLLVVVERKGWKFSLAISIISILVFWSIFELGLQLQLPAGLLDLLQ